MSQSLSQNWLYHNRRSPRNSLVLLKILIGMSLSIKHVYYNDQLSDVAGEEINPAPAEESDDLPVAALNDAIYRSGHHISLAKPRTPHTVAGLETSNVTRQVRVAAAAFQPVFGTPAHMLTPRHITPKCTTQREPSPFSEEESRLTADTPCHQSFVQNKAVAFKVPVKGPKSKQLALYEGGTSEDDSDSGGPSKSESDSEDDNDEDEIEDGDKNDDDDDKEEEESDDDEPPPPKAYQKGKSAAKGSCRQNVQPLQTPKRGRGRPAIVLSATLHRVAGSRLAKEDQRSARDVHEFVKRKKRPDGKYDLICTFCLEQKEAGEIL
ncbi:hypothetical protein PM082_002328 [Marasmius tenuissimus]|nr:hypothetical protein PM082_002328 [Marasmius tenuissimus]